METQNQNQLQISLTIRINKLISTVTLYCIHKNYLSVLFLLVSDEDERPGRRRVKKDKRDKKERGYMMFEEEDSEEELVTSEDIRWVAIYSLNMATRLPQASLKSYHLFQQVKRWKELKTLFYLFMELLNGQNISITF